MQDDKVAKMLRRAFAHDAWETVKAAKGVTGERVYRHTMHDENGVFVFVGFFPKQELLAFPDLSDEFVEKLAVFNMVGVVTDGQARLDLFLLGGGSKPFTALDGPDEMEKLLESEPLLAFMDHYFQEKNIRINFWNLDEAAFMQAVDHEVFGKTPMAQLSKIGELLKQ